MKKIFVILFLGIFLINLVSAFDNQTLIRCGGDEELVLWCDIGDTENVFPTYLEEEITTAPITGGTIFGFEYNLSYLAILLIIIVVIFLIIALTFILIKKEKMKKFK